MCGIVGIVRPAGLAENEGGVVVERMRDTLQHRGPDEATSGVYDGWVALGHRRLSIIDIGGSRQPLRNEDGMVAVVFNGEIYNFRELRQELTMLGHRFSTEGDGEAIVHGYEQWGTGVVARLEGIFAFILVDRAQGRVLVARDRFGVKPVFWAEPTGGIVVASELKAILAHPGVPRHASAQGLALGLSRMQVPWPYTAISGVWRLPPGVALEISRDGSRVLRRFADTSRSPTEPQPDDLAATQTVLENAVRRQLVADVPVGAFLSGGIDSTLLVVLMHRLGVNPLHTFSLGVNRASDDESLVARETARRLGTIHHELRMEDLGFEDLASLPAMYDEPFAEVSALGVRALSRCARQHVKVVLSGDGGDEVFGGYETYRYVQLAAVIQRAMGARASRSVGEGARRALLAKPWADRVRQAMRFALLLGETPAAAHRLLSSLSWAEDDAARDRTESLSALIAERRGSSPPADPFRAAMYSDRLERLTNAMLTKVDIASMSSSLEVRVPMLDDAVVRHADGLPTSALANARWGKLVLRRILERLLPGGPAWHKKRGFALPLAQWIRSGATARRFHALLGDHAQVLRDLQNVDVLEEWRTFQAGTSRRSCGTSAMRLLWLATVALWADAVHPAAPIADEPLPPIA